MRTESFEQRVRNFVSSRNEKLRATAGDHAFWALHIVPLLRRNGTFDVTRLPVVDRLRRIGSPGGGDTIHCLEGLKIHHRDPEGYRNHGVFFRDGSMEFYDEETFQPWHGERQFACGQFLETVSHCLRRAVALYTEGAVNPPFAVSLTLQGVRGYILPDQRRPVPIEEDVIAPDPIVFSAVPVDAADVAAIARAIKPLMDVVWNAFGYPRCRGYNEEGRYVGF